ncbi:tetratricopeptide repeat protein [Phenylobacterium sp.]|uniref:tetratricopeptide repeat protein n=1 Tax=Phenylobacterium sp. TaxID=1871053 RepID=UPI00301D8AC7
MAADGAWPHGGEPGSAAEPPDDLRRVLAAVERRLGGHGDAMSPEAARALVRALERLAARVAHQETAVLAALEVLAARLDSAANRGGLVVNAPRRDPWPVRAVMAASTSSALLAALTAATVAFGPHGQEALRGVPSMPAAHDAVRRRLAPPDAPSAAPSAAGLGARVTKAAPPVSPGRPADSYEAAAAALQKGDPQALARLNGLAQADDPRAQLLLAGLYETGRAGLPRDLSAARMWTRRAAGSGDRMAMHNLGLFLMAGEGGPRDPAEAAAWFRRAAERGVVDSQYNLGLLYEAGQGVPRNLREAYRWLSVAANAGDLAAREKQIEVEARLAPAERAGLDRDVAAFQPGALSPDSAALIVPPAATIAESQAFLARRGYYLGPIDGAPSAGYATAVAAWRKDHPGDP